MAVSIQSLSRTIARNRRHQQLAALAAAAQVLPHARRLADGFHDYCVASHQLAHRAPEHFGRREWQASQMDAVERQQLFGRCVAATVSVLAAAIDDTLPASFWLDVQVRYGQLVDPEADAPLVSLFFSRVTQRLCEAAGIPARSAIAEASIAAPAPAAPAVALRHYHCRDSVLAGFRRLLADLPLDAEWQDLTASARQAAAAIPPVLQQGPRQEAIESLELLPVVFYRFTRAYAVGRLVSQARGVPMALAMTNTASGAIIDDLLLGEATLGALFRTQPIGFQPDLESHGTAAYLGRLMPALSAQELSVALGTPGSA